jgi:hypothetical protein
MQTHYNLSTKQKREVFSNYSKQINFDFYFSIADDIVDYRDHDFLQGKSESHQKDLDFKSLLNNILMN